MTGIENARILIVDDHPLFCEALSLTVQEIFEAPDVRTASTLLEAIEVLADCPEFALIVLDLNLPDVEGIEGLIRLRAVARSCKIVVVSSISDNSVIASVLDTGAEGFIPKGSTRSELVKAFTKVLQDEVYVPLDFHRPKKKPIDQDQQVIIKRLESLTPQQAIILSMLCEGKLNKQIAFELSIVETTVKAHLTAILRKLGVQNRTQAVLLANKVSFSSLTELAKSD